MINLAGTPRILKRRKVLDQLLNRHRRPPFVDEGRTVTPRYTVKSHQPISCVAPANAPKSRSSTRSPRAKAAVIVSKMALTIFSTSRWYRCGFSAAILSINSDLIIGAFEGARSQEPEQQGPAGQSH